MNGKYWPKTDLSAGADEASQSPAGQLSSL